MTNPRRPSLSQARGMLPHFHSRSHAYSHPRPLSLPEGSESDIDQSPGPDQRSPRDSDTQPNPGPQGRPLNADDAAPPSDDFEFAAFHVAANAVDDDVPLASQVSPTTVPLAQTVDPTIGALVPAHVTPVVPVVVPTLSGLPTLSSLPDLPNTSAVGSRVGIVITATPSSDIAITTAAPGTTLSTLRGNFGTSTIAAIVNATHTTGPPDSIVATSEPGSLPGTTNSIPPPVLANATAQATTTTSALTSLPAILTPSVTPPWPTGSFNNGRNTTAMWNGTVDGSQTQSAQLTMPSNLNGTNSRHGAPPSNVSGIASLRPPTSLLTAFLKVSPSESSLSPTRLLSAEAIATTTTAAAATSSFHASHETTAEHSKTKTPSVPAPTPMIILDSPHGSSGTSTTSSDGHGSGTLSTQQKQIVGGVVGSLAGVAFLAVLIMLVLRHRKRAGGRGLITYLPSAAAGGRGLLPGQGPPPGGEPGLSDTGGAMAERSLPAGGAAAVWGGMAGRLMGRPPSSVDSGEKSFYRVSGRKLPSVLQVGGDGYSDPRESSGHQSNQYTPYTQNTTNSQGYSNAKASRMGSYADSDPIPGRSTNINDRSNDNYINNGSSPGSPVATSGRNTASNLNIYQALRAYDSMDDITSQIALGNPMRPISGIPFIRSGPVRTPVTITETNPFDDQPESPGSEGTIPSPVMRDGPGGSRFLEDVM